MLTKRLIPCLDVKDGRVVKGVQFVDLQDQGDPVELASHYNQQGADELVFLDITASKENRGIIEDIVEKTARELFIPFTVGGGIKNKEQMRRLIAAGADKISINTAAVKNPDLITEAADLFGSQAVVVAVDARSKNSGWQVVIKGGSVETDMSLLEWVKEAEERGAGEILLTSRDRDGTRDGYDLEMLSAVAGAVNIPLIASGGAGSPEHLYRALEKGKADAVLAASIWHQGDYTIKECKQYLAEKGVPIRPISGDHNE